MARLPGHECLHLAIGLPLRNQAALGQLLQQIYRPGQPELPALSDTRAIRGAISARRWPITRRLINFAQANGLTVTGQHANRALLDVDGDGGEHRKGI